MVPPRIQPKQLAVQHMRKPGEGMPVEGMRIHERPYESPARQTVPHHRIVEVVNVVVVLNKIEVTHRPISCQSSQNQNQTNQSGLLFLSERSDHDPEFVSKLLFSKIFPSVCSMSVRFYQFTLPVLFELN